MEQIDVILDAAERNIRRRAVARIQRRIVLRNADPIKEDGTALGLLRDVANQTGISVPQMRGASRARKYARARWTFTILASELFGASCVDIGLLVDRDRSTVEYGLSQGLALAGKDENFAGHINAVRERWA